LAAGDNFYHEKDKNKIKQVCKKYNIPTDKKYVFSLCTLEPRKNLIRSVKTFIEFIKKNKINDMVFVLGGAHWDEFIGKLESEIKDLGKYKNKIIRAGYIDDEDLAALYSGAEFFVYTSQYEGFGLPPLEAMQCGTPVITSNNSSLPEVVGDAGIMIDWDSDEQHIAAYEKYYFDEKYREKMAKKGLTRSRQFSWKNTVDVMINQMKKDI
jgi:glycosyltransferase involved in cell wall biosynthesis